MKRSFLFFLCWLTCCLVEVSAQSEVVRQINDIKRNSSYFYNEATLATEQEARQAAALLLTNFINNYILDNDIKVTEKITEQEVDAKAKMLKMNRGELIRVFLYVEKAAFIPGYGAADAAPVSEPVQAAAPVQEAAPVSEPVQIAAPVQEAAPVSEPVQAAAPVQETAPVSEPVQAAAPVEEAVQTQPEEAAMATVESTVAAPVSGDESLKLAVSWQQLAIDDMLKKNTLLEVINLLGRLKDQYKVRKVGTFKECQNAAASFWVIFENDENKSLITVLGPGTDARVNFKTLQYDSLANYSGKNAIWFDFAK